MSDPTASPSGDDDQVAAEQLDEDGMELDDYPPDRLQGAGRSGTTASEASGGESVAERDVRYDHRQDLREPAPPMAGLVDVQDGFDPDLTRELVADQVDEPDGYSAEEAAMHVVDDEG
jgi:hypothetical protein